MQRRHPIKRNYTAIYSELNRDTLVAEGISNMQPLARFTGNRLATSFFPELFKKVEIGKIQECLDDIFVYEDTKREVKRQLTHYMLEHAAEIYIHQSRLLKNYLGRVSIDDILKNNYVVRDLVLEKVNAQPVEKRNIKVKLSNNTIIDVTNQYIFKQYILEFKQLVKQTDWIVDKLGPFGGKTIMIDGKKRIVPSNIAAAFKECEAALNDKQYEKHFLTVIKLGHKAKQPTLSHRLGLFKRDENTQRIYDYLDDAYRKLKKKR